jgi:hypothetical protein
VEVLREVNKRGQIAVRRDVPEPGKEAALVPLLLG